jgi:hypothetical protein
MGGEYLNGYWSNIIGGPESVLFAVEYNWTSGSCKSHSEQSFSLNHVENDNKRLMDGDPLR